MIRNNFNIETVEELLNSSKQLQSKIRKELNLQAIESRVVSEYEKPATVPLPPATEDAMLVSYVDNFAADYLKTHNRSNEFIKSNTNIKSLSQVRKVKTKIQSLSLNSNKREKLKNSFSNFDGTSAPGGIQVAEKTSTKSSSRIWSLVKRKTNQNVCDSSVNSRINLESNWLAATSSSQFPLQRFVGHKNKSIDFFKEHPHLQLDMTAEQTTLFPRRLHRLTDRVSQNDGECFKVLEAETKPPKENAEDKKPETWNGILKQNKPHKQVKIVRVKKNNEAVLVNTLNCLYITPEPQKKEPEKSYDIITSNSSKGLFTFRKQSHGLADRKKCHLQRFPVLYIKPECIVQKVTNISIYDKTKSVLTAATAVENSTSNVKYVECRHEDEKKTFGLESIPVPIKTDMNEKVPIKETIAIKENKFSKAQYSPTISEYSSLDRKSFSSNRSYASLSSSSSLVKNVIPTLTVTEIQHSLRSSPTSMLSTKTAKNSVRNLPSRCEVHVQTEKKCEKSISTMTPLQNPEKLQSELTTTENRDHKFENSSGDDVIAQIFQRILSDLPNALEKYKNRNIPKISFSKNKCNQVEKNLKDQKQMPDLNVKLIGKYLPNENSKEKTIRKKRYVQPISQMISVDSSDNSSRSMLGAHKEVLLKRNPLFVQTIQNQSSTVHDEIKDVKMINYIKQEYLKEAEIKRAVKIFIDSLTVDGCNVDENVILNDTRAKKGSRTLPKLKFIIKDKLYKHSNSDFSNTSNSLTGTSETVKNVKNLFWSEISGSSSPSIALFSTDSETETTNDVHTISSSSHTNNISEGEIKSIGEM